MIEKTFNQFKIEEYDEVSSTNSMCIERALQMEEEGLVIIANEQSLGRGRSGKSFFSPKCAGLYMSVLLRPAFDISEAMNITVMAGAALSKVLDKVFLAETRIKWVNDIYLEDKKVAGILVESGLNKEGTALSYVVLGIGVNLGLSKDGFPAELTKKAGALTDRVLDEESLKLYKNKVSEGFLDEFGRMYADYTLGGLPKENVTSECLKDYREKSYLTGKSIRFKDSITSDYRVLGISDDFGLELMDRSRRTVTKYSGEIIG